MNRPPDRLSPPPVDEVYPLDLPTVADLRARVLARAQSYVGTKGGDHFFDVAAPCYPTPAARKGKSYCQIALLTWLIEEGITDRVWRDCIGVFGDEPTTKDPQLSDAVIFPYSKGGAHVEHGCLFVRRDGHQLFTIDANTTGGLVRAKERDLRDYAHLKQRPYFVDLSAWFDAAVERMRELEIADTEPPGAA